jgi:hypothetical protein
MRAPSVLSKFLKPAIQKYLTGLASGVLIRSVATVALVSSVHAQAQTEIALPLPPSIEFGQCRPVNIGSAEMVRQWDLHYRYAKRMQPSQILSDEERKGLAAQAMSPERIECFVGSDIFGALCFTKSRTKRLDIRAIKIMHSASWADCLALVTAIKRN